MKPLAIFVVSALVWGLFAMSAGAAPAEKKDEDAIPARLIEAARGSFVIVETFYKKDLTESPSVISSDYALRRIYGDYIDQKRPSLQTGVVLDAAGRVLIADDGVEQRFIDKVEIRDSNGKRYPARRESLLSGAPAIVLKVDKPHAAQLKAPTFVPVENKGVDTKLMAARMYQDDDEWRLRFGPVLPSLRYAGDPGRNVYYGLRISGRYSRGYSSMQGGVDLISDTDGQPVGISVSSTMDLQQTEGLWKGADLVAARGMSMAELEKARTAIRKRLAEAVQEVVFSMRQGSGGGLSDASSAYRYRDRSGGGASGREVSQYGVAISATRILVPLGLSRSAAKQIEKVHVKFSPKKRAAAKFVGAFKGFGAYLIELTEGKLPSHLSVSAREKDLPRMEPFWVAQMEKRFGEKHVRLTTNRIVGKERGYAGKYHPQPRHSISSGAILADLDGQFAGVYMQQRIENEEAKALESSSSSRYSRYDGFGDYRYGSSDTSSRTRIFMASEIRQPLAQPTAHLDPKIKVKTKTEAKRRAWLGVEYVGMHRGLAERWKIEKPTKDGQLGFLVNAVYPGSPAKKLGIRVGDILLRIKAPGVPYPIELAGGGRDDLESRFRFSLGGYGDDSEMTGPPAATWKPRANYLTMAMDTIGVGKKISIAYCRRGEKGQGEQRDLEYTIEQAPRDFKSAPKWKNRKLGLTVKDLTYEIRYALNLKDDHPGVIVAHVEPGSPMLVAKIFPNEIVTRLNDKPLGSARAMRDQIAAAKQAGKKKVRLTVLRLGKTRFADLTVVEYDAKDDEGLEEKTD